MQLLPHLSRHQQNGLCAQWRLRSAQASAQSDQSSLSAWRNLMSFLLSLEQKSKTLIKLGRCPGWSGSSLGAHTILLRLSCCGSFLLCFTALQDYFTYFWMQLINLEGRKQNISKGKLAEYCPMSCRLLLSCIWTCKATAVTDSVPQTIWSWPSLLQPAHEIMVLIT